MAFMMPVVKNDWDIYNSQRSRRTSENSERGGGGGGRVRKVSESRSEGPGFGSRSVPMSPHRSAPAMRSLSYVRAPPSQVSLQRSPADSGSARRDEKLHTRLVERLKRALSRGDSRAEERTS